MQQTSNEKQMSATKFAADEKTFCGNIRAKGAEISLGLTFECFYWWKILKPCSEYLQAEVF